MTLAPLLCLWCACATSTPSPKEAPMSAEQTPRWEELKTRLPVPEADDRVEVHDAARGRVVSFPGHRQLRHYPHFHRPRAPGELYTRQVWSAAVTDRGVSAFRKERDLPAELAFGSYWARAVFSGGGRRLYLTGPFDTRAVYVSDVDAGGRLGPWRATEPMPAGPRSRRSLHQALVVRGKLLILGGWYEDNKPAMDQLHAAPLAADGAVGTFRLLNTKLPFSGVAFSLARCDDRLFLAWKDTIWVASLDEGGAPGAFRQAVKDPRINHLSYGNSGMACCGDTLALADAQQTHLFTLAPGKPPRPKATVKHPAPFSRRPLFCHRGAYMLTTTHEGRIYRLTP